MQYSWIFKKLASCTYSSSYIWTVDIIASNAIMLLLKLVGMQASDSERLRLENLDLELYTKI